MHRTERCFRQLHERIVRLETGQASQTPTDEQIERVLRKILAERFSDPAIHHHKKRDTMQDGDYFVRDPNDTPYPKLVKMDIASLIVSPESVPSQAYTETFRMLESRLNTYPGPDLTPGEDDDDEDIKTNTEFQENRTSGSV
jgi:hypothetical protein